MTKLPIVLAIASSVIASSTLGAPAAARPVHASILRHEAASAPAAQKSMVWSDAQARRDAYAFFPAPRAGSFTAAPRDVPGGVCDHGDNPGIC